MTGYAPIRRGLLEHAAALGPYAGWVYVVMHLIARATGPDAGTVRTTERELAARCGMSAGTVHRALATLQPRYIVRVGGGAYRIERFQCSTGEQLAPQGSNLLPNGAACSTGERHIRNEKEEGCKREEAPLPPTPIRPSTQRHVFAAAAIAAAAGEILSPTSPTSAPAAAGTSPHAGALPAAEARAHRSRAAAAVRTAAAAPQPSAQQLPHVHPQSSEPRHRAAANHPPSNAENAAVSATARRAPDPRHAPVRAAIVAAYAAANGGRECPWSGRHARLLAASLAAAPSWPPGDWLACVRHRFGSDLPPGEDPAHWLASLASYRDGPLDRYHRVVSPVPTAPAASAAVCVDLPDWVPAQQWLDYVAARAAMRSPIRTESQAQYCVRRLEALRADGHDPAAVLAQSIAHGWCGLFPMEVYQNGKNQLSYAEQTRRNAAIALERARACAAGAGGPQ